MAMLEQLIEFRSRIANYQYKITLAELLTEQLNTLYCICLIGIRNLVMLD